ncbi:MAG: response regulator, partial [Thiovulaceae bacterium]|nr:response regulator [Sulfurimonadaceae bacterium]
MKILVVDDEALARTRLVRMLGSLGHENAQEAGSADEALERVQQEEFDVVFLDINMPKKSGLELGYELKYLSEDIAIIFQTAYEEHALKAFDIGAVGYLVKPYSTEQLRQTLDRVLKAKQAQPKEYRLLSKYGDAHLLLRPDEIA